MMQTVTCVCHLSIVINSLIDFADVEVILEFNKTRMAEFLYSMVFATSGQLPN